MLILTALWEKSIGSGSRLHRVYKNDPVSVYILYILIDLQINILIFVLRTELVKLVKKKNTHIACI